MPGENLGVLRCSFFSRHPRQEYLILRLVCYKLAWHYLLLADLICCLLNDMINGSLLFKPASDTVRRLSKSLRRILQHLSAQL
jgi:hypothetical protein